MDTDSITAICPLINFQISEVLIGKYTHQEVMEYSAMLREKFQEGIEVLDNIRIRRMKKEDLEGIRKWGMVDYYADFFSRINASTFVIEFLQKDLDMKEIELEIYKLLLAMRLYKAGSVFCKIFWILENSEYNTLAVLDTRIPEMMGVQYVIDIDEIQEIGKLAEKIDKIDLDKRKSFRIACERFNRAYEEYKEDEILIDLIISLESLLGVGQEMRYRLSLRASVLLGIGRKENQSRIFHRIWKLYQKRNNIVHGVKDVKVLPDEISSLKNDVRDSILILLNLDLPRRGIVSLLDQSLLDVEAREKLEGLCRDVTLPMLSSKLSIYLASLRTSPICLLLHTLQ